MSRRPPRWLWLLCCLLAAPGLVAAGAPGPAGLPAAEAPADPYERSTPHGTVVEFLRAVARQDYPRATLYLDLRKAHKPKEELARQLKAVLDSATLINLDILSRRPEGKTDDDLPLGRELIGTVKYSGGALEVYLDRVQRGQEGTIWLFSSDTLHRIPEVFEETRGHWLERWMPEALARSRLLDFPLWQWLLTLIAIPLALALAWPLNWMLTWLLQAIFRRLVQEEEDRLLRRTIWPLRLLVFSATIQLGSQLLGLPFLATLFWFQVSVTLAVVAVAWLLACLVDILGDLTSRRLERLQGSGNTALIRLGRRLLKAAIVLAGALLLLSWTGVNLTAAMAGLGLGGLAIAFSAQKTLENLFGGIMLISDKAIRVGDFCRIGEQVGTVEDIGLRSTRLRTLGRTLVNIPNGQLSAMSLENFAFRDKILFSPTIGLRYETTPDQLRRVLDEVRRLLLTHPKVEAASARVRFTRLGGSALELEIFSYVLETDFAAFLAIQEELLLRILELVEASGTAIAFPSTTTYLAQDGGVDPGRPRAAAETLLRAVRERREAADAPPGAIAASRDASPHPPADPPLRPTATGGDPPQA